MHQSAAEQECDFFSSSEENESNLVHLLEDSADEQNISMNNVLESINDETTTFQDIFFENASIREEDDLSERVDIEKTNIAYFNDQNCSSYVL